MGVYLIFLWDKYYKNAIFTITLKSSLSSQIPPPPPTTLENKQKCTYSHVYLAQTNNYVDIFPLFQEPVLIFSL